MRRKVVFATVALLAVGPATAGALGAGGITTDSVPPNDAEQPPPSPTQTGENGTAAFDGATPVELVVYRETVETDEGRPADGAVAGDIAP